MELEIKDQHSQLLIEATDKGAEHGQSNSPSAESTVEHPFEGGLREKYQEIISKLSGERVEALKAYSLEKIAQIKKELETLLGKDFSGEINKVNTDATNEIEEASNQSKYKTKKIGAEPAYKTAKNRNVAAERDFAKQSNRVGRIVSNRIGFPHQALYWMAMILLAGAEAYINKATIETMVSSKSGAGIAAIAVVVVFLLISHFGGEVIRQSEKKFGGYAMVFLVSLVAIAFGGIRALEGVEFAVEPMGSVEIAFQYILWIALALGLFLGATFVAYLNVDTDKAFFTSLVNRDKQAKDYIKAKKEMNSLMNIAKDQFITFKKKVEDKQNADLKEIENRAIMKEEELVGLQSTRDTLNEKYDELENGVNSNYKESAYAYRTSNIENRIDFNQPTAWNDELNGLKLSKIN